MSTVYAAAAITPKQTINWDSLLATSFGIFFSLVIGFFILEFILAALNLATNYEDAKALETAKKTFTSAIKGLVVSLGAFVVLNTILPAIGVTGSITNPLSVFTTQINKLIGCVRDYSTCN